MASPATARADTVTVPPGGVDFTALDTRLSTIERSFSESSSTVAGSALIILGIWTRALIGPSTPPLLAALALVSLGLCFNAIDIAFMASAGTQLATLAQAGHGEMGTLFDSLHRVGLMTARFGNLLVALGAIVLSWVERQENPASPWPSRLAWIAGGVGLFCVICFPEASLAILAAVTLLAGWQVATAWRGLRAR